MTALDPATPRDVRAQIRAGRWRSPTAGLAPGFAQANLVVLPRELAYDFLVFCQRNSKACPVLEITEVGSPEPLRSARGADLRTDIPLYRAYRNGGLTDELLDLRGVWREGFVAFLLGCSFTFEAALMRTGIPVRHVEERKNVPMYITNVPCVPAGIFAGPLVVSMRPIPARLVPHAVQVTGRYYLAHGTPVHFGDPQLLGIGDLARPDFGDPVAIRSGEIPVFWACGVTPQAVALRARVELMITHAPGHMFITDLRDEELALP
jgi:uncharacterized protein YcsI (UPF0317 family)